MQRVLGGSDADPQESPKSGVSRKPLASEWQEQLAGKTHRERRGAGKDGDGRAAACQAGGIL